MNATTAVENLALTRTQTKPESVSQKHRLKVLEHNDVKNAIKFQEQEIKNM